MLNLERIDEFVDIYMENADLENELTDKLLEPVGKEEWYSRIEERSRVLRASYMKNEELLREIMSGGSFAKGKKLKLDKNSADKLYNGLMRLYDNAYDDCSLILDFALPLIRYYELHRDYERLIRLYQCVAFETTEFFGRINGDSKMYDSAAYYYKIIALKRKYSKIKDVKVRRCFFTAYANLIAPLGQMDKELQKKVFDIYDEAMTLWNSKEVQELDGDDEEFQDLIISIRENLMISEDYIEKLTDSEKERFCLFAHEDYQRLENEAEDDSLGTVVRAYYKALELENASSISDIAHKMYEYYMSIGIPDYEEKSEEENLDLILNHHNSGICALRLLERLPDSDPDKQTLIENVLTRDMSIHYNIPYNFYPTGMSNVCSEWFKDTERYIHDFDNKMEFAFRMIVCRQLHTHIHSIMVSKIACFIADRAFDANEAAFACIDCGGSKEKLLEYIKNCALLHDIGKTSVAAVINIQSRPITSEEFELIKLHPTFGRKMLHDNPIFNDYYDIIEGHHRSYDGRSGYPATFDNVSSDYKFIIDLITIADCIDASTDTVGRNYMPGKSFDAIMLELKEGAGTLYNPVIVELIASNDSLRDDIRKLVTEGRIDVCYEVYSKYIE